MIRILTGLSLILAFAAGLYDAAQSVAQERLVTTSLGETWFSINNASLNLAEVVIERYIWAPLWNPGIVTVLQWPTWMVFGGLAIALGIIGRIARM